ncbi:hypothetical protein KGQ74_01800, partial [Patescibacteria group bacterium]|nr:hypothetical protein [Patescibacteria group bacterium]
EANLWIILQPKAWTESKIEFCDLHTKLQSLNLNYENQILISYNDKNEKEVLVQVYPQLAKMTRLHKKYIEQL